MDKIHSRKPLETLNAPGPSQHEPKAKNRRLSSPLRIETENVTVRHDNDKLEGCLINDLINSSVIIISDDEDNLKDEGPHDDFNNGEVIHNLDTKKAVTPKWKTLKPKPIKNIKTLKRLHSGELQGLSPEAKKEQKDGKSNTFKRRLEFNEIMDDKLQPIDNLARSLTMNDNIEDIFPYLLETERTLLDVPKVSTVIRVYAINLIIHLNSIRTDYPGVIQAAINFFDSFLVRYNVRDDKLVLLASACYWIANKLETQDYVSAAEMVEYSSNNFTATQLMDAEQEILTLLDFPRQPVVQQDFITFFIWFCDEKASKEIEMSATFLCISGTLVNRALGKEYPSVVAAAAVKNALMLLEKEKETLMRLESSPVYQKAVKKSTKFENLCSELCQAAETASTLSEYIGLAEIYGRRPHFIAQRITMAYRQRKMIS